MYLIVKPNANVQLYRKMAVCPYFLYICRVKKIQTNEVCRYLFRYEKQEPTLENIQIDFGESSGLFITVFGELKSYFEKTNEDAEILISYQEWKNFLSIAYGSFNASTDIFLVHTYLSVFSKLLAYSVITHDQFIDDDELREILSGDIFTRLKVENFVENDFYKWIIHPKYFVDLKPIFRRIAVKISYYEYTNVKSDILKGVYQELIDLETRHALGEYYTPDWLCEKIAQKYDFERNAKILDPSCGSGSFLLAAIARLKKLHPDISVEEISSQVFGIDIHPLSVQIAKTTLLLAFGDLLRNVKRPIQLKVFLSNSIISPEDSVNLFDEKFRVKVDNINYFFPVGTFDDPELFDYMVGIADQLANDTLNNEPIKPIVLQNSLKNYKRKISEDLLNKFYEIYLGLKAAKENGRDSIWKFILQNTYKPYFLKSKFDYIIGNPPWFTYSSIKNSDYQKELRLLAEKYQLIPAKKANMPHLEIAAIFLSHCTFYFLNDKGKLAFVLPRSFISAGHHDNSRSGTAKGFKLNEVWDLEKVTPLFNVPSTVWFVQKSIVENKIPDTGINGLEIRGKFKYHNSTLTQIENKLTENETKWYYSNLNGSSALTNIPLGSILKKNFYKKHFKQGATIVPRNFYFVELLSEKPDDWDDRIISVQTDMEINKNAKMPWKELYIKGELNSNYLYRTALAKNIIPFGIIAPNLISLPIKSDKYKNIILLDYEKLRENGDLYSARWFEKTENIWNKYRTENNQKINSVDYLNWQNKLTEQDLNKKYLVLYTASGKDACAVVIQNNQFDLPFITESTCYVLYTENEDEAYYITAFLNSNTPNEIIKDFQARGLFGPRHIHKKILDVPLTRYNAKLKLHKDLVKISKSCKKKADDFIITNNLETKNYNVGRERLKFKKLIETNLEKMDKTLKQIINRA